MTRNMLPVTKIFEVLFAASCTPARIPSRTPVMIALIEPVMWIGTNLRPVDPSHLNNHCH